MAKVTKLANFSFHVCVFLTIIYKIRISNDHSQRQWFSTKEVLGLNKNEYQYLGGLDFEFFFNWVKINLSWCFCKWYKVGFYIFNIMRRVWRPTSSETLVCDSRKEILFLWSKRNFLLTLKCLTHPFWLKYQMELKYKSVMNRWTNLVGFQYWNDLNGKVEA